MNPIDNALATTVLSAGEVTNQEEVELIELRELEDELAEPIVNSSLSGHIMKHFITNRQARQNSGMELKMLQSIRAYNGHYDPEDLARIRQNNGSTIYMNLTSTKCRAAMSWIRDIMLPAKELAWSFEPTPLPDIPAESQDKIKSEIEAFIEAGEAMKAEGEKKEAEATQQSQQAPGSAPEPGIPAPVKAANEMKDMNQMYRDIYEAFQNEVYKMAEVEVKRFETIVEDQLVEGDWYRAFSEFIEDFCVFPVAIMKGPVVTKKNKVSWDNGEPVVKEDYIFLNKRVSPLDIYPSPSAVDITDGNLCEHVRYSRDELYDMIGIKGYNEEHIRDILEGSREGTFQWLDTQIEEDKAVEEYRGNSYDANRGVYHGIHFHGSSSGDMLLEWGIDPSFLDEDHLKEYEIEAILVQDKVIFVEINGDPLLRRPYYKSSFQNIPGSWWGRSLPELMRDIQRMCNATARALANNMGVASGPQVEVYTDRLAADEHMEDIYPFKIWQVTSDPSGAGGRAVQFWQPGSNAAELLKVYQEFEIRADDATGVPRYAYGNERSGGAAATAMGMSMLLESMTKGIKDAVRHIDDGCVKPRVEYQFYWNLVSDPNLKFSGDIVVVPKGSSTLTTKGAQEQRRNEFLQILANPAYLEIVGTDGIADILREMAKSLGLSHDLIPSRIELKFNQAVKKAEMAKAQQAAAEMEQAQNQVGVQQVQMQVQQAEQASQRNAELKQLELQLKQQIESSKQELKAMEMEMKQQLEAIKVTANLEKQQMVDAQKDRSDNKNIALSIQSGYEDKNNKE